MQPLQNTLRIILPVTLAVVLLFGCSESSPMESEMEGTDPDTAPVATIDRFSEDAGTLMIRSDQNNLPEPGEPIDFDQAPFITQGLAPDGTPVRYYNFDVQSTTPAPIYAFFYENGDPVQEQLNVVDVIPGDDGYNDFWRVNLVTVPDNYVANSITNAEELMDANYQIEQTDMLVNCPVVPEGSTAGRRLGDAGTGLTRGWYKDQIITYFSFEESPLMVTSGGTVPLSPIYVAFNVNPGQDGGGPASGFMTEQGNMQTHNVVATTPSDMDYSPFWLVNVYDNTDFSSVSDLSSAMNATQLASGAAMVNCPVVWKQQ